MSNPNFIRPGDAGRAVANKNFVSREAANIRAVEVEGAIGQAVRRPDETPGAYKKRAKAMEDKRKGQRARSQMSPAIARRELAQLEQKWADRVPTKEEVERYADEFDYMNDCRVSLGWPEVDYTQARDQEKGDGSQQRYIAFKRKPERERLVLAQASDDLALMRLASVHDESESVRQTAERRMQHLWATVKAQ